jgi:hypothetical protein
MSDVWCMYQTYRGSLKVVSSILLPFALFFSLFTQQIIPQMSTGDERTNYFASLCEQLYNPKSPEERNQVQKILEHSFPTFTDSNGLPSPGLENQPSFVINSPTDTASALRVLLESSPNPYVQTFALSRLKQLVQAQFALFSQDSKIQLRKFLFFSAN